MARLRSASAASARGGRSTRSRIVGICLASWLALLLSAPIGCRQDSPETPDRRNVLFVVVDALRADHLHLYGYPRRTSDHIDALGASGWVFENHIANSAQTVPSTLSLLLSMLPAEHGILHLRKGYFLKNRPHYPKSLVFLSEVFQDAGYRTGGFVGNPFLTRKNGFAQGFDHFVYSKDLGETLTEAAIRWLSVQSQPDHPFFAYVHYFDVHAPYKPPGRYRDLFERPAGGRYLYRNGPAPEAREVDVQTIVALYDGEIAYVDDQIGELMAALERLGVLKDTLIVVTSDHGDEFLEHGGLGHGTSVYGELVRVPLVLAGPGIGATPRRVAHLTRHLDLAPTVLALAGLEAPPSFRGRTLATTPPRAFSDDGPWLGVYGGGRKIILDRSTGEVTTFAMDDKLDQRAIDDPSATAALLEQARWYADLEPAANGQAPAAEGRTGGRRDWSKREVEHLRALGYVE